MHACWFLSSLSLSLRFLSMIFNDSLLTPFDYLWLCACEATHTSLIINHLQTKNFGRRKNRSGFFAGTKLLKDFESYILWRGVNANIFGYRLILCFFIVSWFLHVILFLLLAIFLLNASVAENSVLKTWND